MLLKDLTPEEAAYLELFYASDAKIINRETLVSTCNVSFKKARGLLKAWVFFGYVKTYTHSSGGYGIKKQNLWTDKTKDLFEKSKANYLRQQKIFQPVDTRTDDSGPLQVSTYTKLLILNKVNSVASDEEGNYEVKKMPDPFLSDSSAPQLSDFELEQLEQKKKTQALQRDEREAAKKARFAKQQTEIATRRKVERYKNERKDWSETDLCYEFAFRLSSFHIPPWDIVQTNFLPALIKARLKHNVSADVIYLMILKYQEIVDFNQFNTGDKLWRNFIFRFSQLADIVRAQYSTPEEIERNDKIVERSRQKLMELKKQLEDERSNVQD